MKSCEWVATITALAMAIAKGRSAEEIQFLSNLFLQLGDTLTVLSLEPPKGC